MAEIDVQLFLAVKNEDEDLVKNLLIAGANVNTTSKCGQSILGLAVRKNKVNIIDILLNCETYYQLGIENKKGVENDLVFDETSPQEMSFSMLWGPLGPFSSRRKCNVNITDAYERTPLHYAAELGNTDVLNSLLSAGCRVNACDSENISPLHVAVSRQHLSCVRNLLRNNCSVNLKTRYTSDKLSALHMAASIGDYKIAYELLKHGAKIDILDASERSPLYLAVCKQNYDVVKLLLQNGAKVNIVEIHGYTPLVEAVWKNDEKLVYMLTQAGANVNSSRMHNILHFSVSSEQTVITKFLIDAGCEVNMKNDCGDTPLHIACRKGIIGMVEFLTDCGASVFTQNGITGTFPIHESVSGIPSAHHQDFEAILNILLKYNSPLNVETLVPGETPLYKAIVLEKFSFAQLLIVNGCNVNLGCVYTCNIDNLYLVIKKNCFKMVELLILAGFNLNNISWFDSFSFRDSRDQPKMNSIKDLLIKCKTNPLSLINLCRINIRRTIGENNRAKIRSLCLPKRMNSFLLFESNF